MGPYEDLFKDIHPAGSLGEDFDARVLGKICHKKRQRKQMTVLAFGLSVMLGLGLWVFSPSGNSVQQPVQPMLADLKEMEEVPLLEDVTFSASDHRTEYPVELVSLTAATEGGM